MILSTAPALIMILDRKGNILLFSDACEKVTGYHRREVRGSHFSKLLPEDEREGVEHTFRQLVKTGESCEFINDLVGKYGNKIRVAWSNSVYDGEKTGARRILSVGIDITDKVNTEKALIASESKSKTILETIADGIITINEAGNILSFNKAAENIFGYTVDEVIGKKIGILMPAPYREEHNGYLNRYLKTGERKIIGTGREVEGLRNDGTIFPMDLSVSEASWGGTRIFTGIVRDITERRRLEQEVLRVGDMERQRIGQELHDSLGQMLTGISLLSKNLADRLMANSLPGADEVEEIAGLVKEADSFTRNLAHTLVPVEIENEGLTLALEKLSRQTSSFPSVHCAYEDEYGMLIENRIAALHLYRIAQEAVHNAIKHGHAQNILIHISIDNELLVLRVEDDGIGFETNNQFTRGMGLRLMKYRSRVLGGELHLCRTPEQKTRVECRIPLMLITQVTRLV